VIVQLGPLGGASAGGVTLVVWGMAYISIVGALCIAVFGRRDL
jgi:hypothetical protein